MRKRKFDEVNSERGNIRELSGDEEQKMGCFGRFLPKTQIGCTGVKPVQPICVFAEEVSSGFEPLYELLQSSA